MKESLLVSLVLSGFIFGSPAVFAKGQTESKARIPAYCAKSVQAAPAPYQAPRSFNTAYDVHNHLNSLRQLINFDVRPYAGLRLAPFLGTLSTLHLTSPDVQWATGTDLVVGTFVVADTKAGLATKNQLPTIFQTWVRILKFIQQGDFILAIDGTPLVKLYSRSGYLLKTYALPRIRNPEGVDEVFPTAIAEYDRSLVAIGTSAGDIFVVKFPVDSISSQLKANGVQSLIVQDASIDEDLGVIYPVASFESFHKRIAIDDIRQISSTPTQPLQRFMFTTGGYVWTAGLKPNRKGGGQHWEIEHAHLRNPSRNVVSARFNENGSMVITVEGDGAVILRDYSGMPIATLPMKARGFAADGRLILRND